MTDEKKKERARKSRIWHHQNRDRALARQKKYRDENPDKVRATQRKSRYGVTQEQYDNLLIEQAYCCAICVLPPRKGRPLSVDHCHTTGKIRGLLCNKCNLTLGRFGDDLAGIMRVAAYLKGEL